MSDGRPQRESEGGAVSLRHEESVTEDILLSFKMKISNMFFCAFLILSVLTGDSFENAITSHGSVKQARDALTLLSATSHLYQHAALYPFSSSTAFRHAASSMNICEEERVNNHKSRYTFSLSYDEFLVQLYSFVQTTVSSIFIPSK
ncbi:hypothetical protein SRHO_G00020170 [Serrasalmus rhombeus]